MIASSKELIESSSVQFQFGAWYEGSLRAGAALTFQVRGFGPGRSMRIRVFRTFYAGKMLTTEEWIRSEDLASCKDVREPHDEGSW
jgi:hypothetical protein